MFYVQLDIQIYVVFIYLIINWTDVDKIGDGNNTIVRRIGFRNRLRWEKSL